MTALPRRRPADNRRTCTKCHRQFRRERGSRREKCYECSPSRVQAGPPAVAPVLPLGTADGEDPPFVAAVRRELAAVDRETTADGILLLDLAATIARGGHTATGLAALRKAYAEQRAAAFAGAAAPADPVAAVFQLGQQHA